MLQVVAISSVASDANCRWGAGLALHAAGIAPISVYPEAIINIALNTRCEWGGLQIISIHLEALCAYGCGWAYFASGTARWAGASINKVAIVNVAGSAGRVGRVLQIVAICREATSAHRGWAACFALRAARQTAISTYPKPIVCVAKHTWCKWGVLEIVAIHGLACYANSWWSADLALSAARRTKYAIYKITISEIAGAAESLLLVQHIITW